MATAATPVDFESPENQHRFQMGTFPQGAAIIPNGYNKIPGFSCGDVHFVPGFPVMAWPMIEWVLDTKYAHLHHATPHAERSLLVFELPESTLTPLMERIEHDFPGVRVFSLPSVGDAERGGIYARRHIDLGVKGEPEAVAAAFVKLREGVHQLGGDIVERPRRRAERAAPGAAVNRFPGFGSRACPANDTGRISRPVIVMSSRGRTMSPTACHLQAPIQGSLR